MLNEDQKKKYIELLMDYKNNPNWKINFYNYKNSLLPKKLYRYRTSNSYNLKALKGNYIWLNSPDKFNDIYDCMLNIDSELLLLYNILNNNWYKNNPFEKDEIQSLLFAEKEIKKGSMDLDLFISYLKLNKNKYIHEKLTSSPYFISYKEIYGCLQQFNANPEPSKKIVVKCKTACFSETYDNILMWSHYAKYNKGFSVEYDTSKCREITKKL